METGGFNFLVATPVTCQRCRHLDAINFAYSYASGILRIRIKENVIGEDSVERDTHYPSPLYHYRKKNNMYPDKGGVFSAFPKCVVASDIFVL